MGKKTKINCQFDQQTNVKLIATINLCNFHTLHILKVKNKKYRIIDRHKKLNNFNNKTDMSMICLLKSKNGILAFIFKND